MAYSRCLTTVAALALSLLALGCSAFHGPGVDGWPELTIVEHHVSDDEMRARCVPYTRPGRRVLACAEFNFAEARCDIWYGNLGLFLPIAIQHERQHCRGYDHAGRSAMGEALRSYRTAGSPDAATAP